MGLFEDVVVNAKEAVNAVGKKAGQMVDISKLRLSAADLNNEISKRFEALGRVISVSYTHLVCKLTLKPVQRKVNLFDSKILAGLRALQKEGEPYGGETQNL